MEIPYVRPGGEFKFNLNVGNIPAPTLMLYLRIDGDQIPEGIGFPGVKVLGRREPQPATSPSP
jgi:hypothetical protein